MQTRILIALGILTLVIGAGIVWSAIMLRRRRIKRLRRRGIKTHSHLTP